MNAVIYARYSSDNQREESIEGQIRECTEFADKQGITILKHYIDRAFSAKTDNRPEFQHMIQDSSKKLFDVIIVWKLDRFARNRYDSARYKSVLKKNGIKVISATETISSGAEGILLESMLEGMAEYFSADLAEKVSRGMTENALKCKFNGGTPLLGYQIDKEQHYQPDPLTAPIVIEIFKQYNEGVKMAHILNWLKERGIKNGRGKDLTHNSINVILHNRKYIGEFRFGDVVIPDGIPPIVPVDLFNQVQDKLILNKKAPARNKADEKYLLTTKLFCGYCGAYMYGESGTSHTGVSHHYYKCYSVKKHLNGCHKKTVRKADIEKLVLRKTMEVVMSDDVIEDIVSMLMELQSQENTTLPLLEKQLKETEIAIENLLNAIQMGVLTKSTKERLEDLESVQEDLKTKITCEKMAKPKITEEQMKLWLLRFRSLDVKNPKHQEMLIDTFVNAVYLYDDKILITFNFRDGSETITLDDAKGVEDNETKGSDMNCVAVPKRNNPNHVFPVGDGFGLFFYFNHDPMPHTAGTK